MKLEIAGRVYTLIHRCTVPGQCRSKGVDEVQVEVGCACVVTSLIFCHSLIPSYNN